MELQSNKSSCRLTSISVRCLRASALLLTVAANTSYGLDPAKNISQYAHASWLVQDGPLAGEVQSICRVLKGSFCDYRPPPIFFRRAIPPARS